MSTYFADDIYYYWVTDIAGGTTNTNSDTWSTWTKGTSDYYHTPTYSAVTTDTAWSTWTNEYHIVERKTKAVWVPLRKPDKSAEQLRAEKVQRDIDSAWREIRIKEEKKRKERVELTAQKLLEDLISEEELALYRDTGRLVVKGRQFDYVLNKDVGVYKVDKDKIRDLCIHLRNRYAFPASDNIISLKLLIESNEKEFLRVANDHGEVYGEKTRRDVMALVNRAA
jgi:hypothetical protein